MPFWVVTPDALPRALEVRNNDGVTLVTNAGSNGKFVGVLDFDVRQGGIKNWSYNLLPVCGPVAAGSGDGGIDHSFQGALYEPVV